MTDEPDNTPLYFPMIYTREQFDSEAFYVISCGDCGRRLGWWRKPHLTSDFAADRNLGGYWARLSACPCTTTRRRETHAVHRQLPNV